MSSTEVTITLGGLVGRNEGAISHSYTVEAVAHSNQGDSRAGGLVGYNPGDITASWAGGSVAWSAEDEELGGRQDGLNSPTGYMCAPATLPGASPPAAPSAGQPASRRISRIPRRFGNQLDQRCLCHQRHLQRRRSLGFR